jgi:hypothetical protein
VETASRAGPEPLALWSLIAAQTAAQEGNVLVERSRAALEIADVALRDPGRVEVDVVKARQDHLSRQIANVRIGTDVIFDVGGFSDEDDLVFANCDRLRDASIRVDRVDEGIREHEVGRFHGGAACE